MLTTTVLALALGLAPAGPLPAGSAPTAAPAPTPGSQLAPLLGWMPLPQAAPTAGAPELALRAFVPGEEDALLARLGRLAPTRFEFDSAEPGRAVLLGQLLEPGEDPGDLPPLALPDWSGLRLHPARATALGQGRIDADGTLVLDLPPACALPLGSRLAVQGHLAPTAGGEGRFSELLVLELVDRRAYDLRSGLAGWSVTPAAPAAPQAAPAAAAATRRTNAGLHLAAGASLELRRVLRGLTPETEVQLAIELRGRGEEFGTGGIQLNLLGTGADTPPSVALSAGPNGSLRGLLRASSDAGGRLRVELLLHNGAEPLDLSALVLTLR